VIQNVLLFVAQHKRVAMALVDVEMEKPAYPELVSVFPNVHTLERMPGNVLVVPPSVFHLVFVMPLFVPQMLIVGLVKFVEMQDSQPQFVLLIIQLLILLWLIALLQTETLHWPT